MTRSARLAAWAAIGVVLWLLVLPWLLPVDEATYRWIQFHWGGSEERVILQLDLAIRIVLGLLAGCLGLAVTRIRAAAVLGVAALIGSGALVSEFLKTAVERLRPESMPIMKTGNSFPSGHVMNTTLFALAVCQLAAMAIPSAGIRRAVYALAVLTVVAQSVCRLGLDAHWVSDLPPSMLLAVVWYCGAPAVRGLRWWGMGAAAVSFAVAFLIFYLEPETRLRLPSAMDDQGSTAASIEFGTPSAQSALVGSWANGSPEPIGPVAWALDREVGVHVSEGSGEDWVMKIAIRPQSCGTASLQLNPRLLVSVNGWSFPPFRLRRGWREYHLGLPANVLRPGVNTVTFHAKDPRVDCPGGMDPGYAAFRYLRLYPESPAGTPLG